MAIQVCSILYTYFKTIFKIKLHYVYLVILDKYYYAYVIAS